MARDQVQLEFSGLAHDHLNVPTLNSNANKLKQLRQQNGSNELNNKSANLQSISLGARCCQLTNDTTTLVGNNSQDVDALATIAILRRHPMYDSLVLVKKYRPCVNGHILEFPTSALKSASEQQEENNEQHKTATCTRTQLITRYLDGDDPIYQREHESYCSQMDDGCELVYVPMNGLIDRLDNYDKQGIAIDGRVYAFAMGLKTSERFLTSSTMKEKQEAPPI